MGEHTISLNNRETLQATGVTYVNSFDEREVVLDTTQGPLVLKGEDLHISLLSLGEGKVVVQGKIELMEYKKSKNIKGKGKNVLSKMLR